MIRSIFESIRSNLFLIFAIATTILYIYFVFSVAIYGQSTQCTNVSKQLESCGAICQLHSSLNVPCKVLSLNEIGDFFAGLFAPFAIIWFAIAFIWQARELKLQRIEYLKGQETAERQLQITKNRNEEDAKRFEQQMATERARLIRATLEAIIVRVNAELGRETQPLLQGDHARCALDAINEVLGLIHNLSSPRDKEQRAKLQSLVDEFPKRLEPIIEMCGDNRAKSIVPISALELEELQRLCFLTQE